MDKRRYAVYDDLVGEFLCRTNNGKLYSVPPRSRAREDIARWSHSKAQEIIKKHKNLRWLFDEKNGNRTKKALRIIRVYSEEWVELTGIISVRVRISKDYGDSFDYWY